MTRRLIALLALIVALFVVAGCGDDDSNSAKGGEGADAASQEECRDVEAPAPKQDGGQRKPKGKLDPAKTYEIEFQTSCGTFTARLDVKGAPNTSASLASLVEKGFYDDTVFHRIVPGFVIQGGDPTGTGAGGPGYKTVDKPPANTAYTPGVLAMAKTGPEPAGTSGSQFFVVTGSSTQLPPDYAVVGSVVEGMDAVMRIEALGDPNGTEQPVKPVVVEKATLKTS